MAKRHHSMMRHDSERAEEKRDAGMIGNDHSAFANLPTQVMMKPYPESPAYMDWNMEDNIKGIDAQLREDTSKRRSGFDPHKY